jgi:hypothetical protein
VGGRNYDDGGVVWGRAGQSERAEMGHWRTEIKPREPALEDDFLMVLEPRLAGSPAPVLRIRKLLGGPGCEIAGPRRTLAVSFPEGSDRPVIRLDGREIEW